MSLLLTMLPVYILGNLHCIGMCGPMVLMIGQHRYRSMYFLGRLLSFSLAGMIAGELGGAFHAVLMRFQIPALTSFVFGAVILCVGLSQFLGWGLPGGQWLAKRLGGVGKRLSVLMTRDKPWPTFLFGFFTIALPCGQTVIVYAACALAGDGMVGLINGMAFALLTSPSLFLAMNAQGLLVRLKQHYNTVMGLLALLVGSLACCRGLAELGLINHFILNPTAPNHLHVVIY